MFSSNPVPFDDHSRSWVCSESLSIRRIVNRLVYRYDRFKFSFRIRRSECVCWTLSCCRRCGPICLRSSNLFSTSKNITCAQSRRPDPLLTPSTGRHQRPSNLELYPVARYSHRFLRRGPRSFRPRVCSRLAG